MKNVLILGAGLVAKPMVHYLLDQKDVEVTIATRTLSKAEKILEGRSNGKAVQLNVEDEAALEEQVKHADVVVSLLPYVHHVKVAKLCLKHGKPMVTTSYVSAAMQELDAEAREKGILLLNEIGLDPGIDHMSAMRIIDNVHQRGGKILAFKSYCGGLPAPDAVDPCCKYKFSWSPRGVLMAGRNDARFLQDGNVVEIDGKELFKHHWPIQIEDLELEYYPNRDSLPYIELYGIKEAKTMFRGTLRFPGWSRMMYAISQLGLLEDHPQIESKNKSYRELVAEIVGMSSDNLREEMAQKLNLNPDDEVLNRFAWLGFFSNDRCEQEAITPIDFLTSLMLQKLQYQSGERDMIVLYHDFIADFPDKQEHITSTLIDYGIPNGDTSMSRTVSLPAAIAVKLILEGKIREVGVKIPVIPEIYHPVLEELERLGIVCKERTEVLPK